MSARFAERLLEVGRVRSAQTVRRVARRAADVVSNVEGVNAGATDDAVLVRGGFGDRAGDGRLRWPGAWVRELLR